MGCCSKVDVEYDEKNEPQLFKKRGCTDILCLLLFGVFWCGIIGICTLCFRLGDPYEVVYGVDHLGNRCGIGEFASKPKVIYPRLDVDIFLQMDIATTMPWKLKFYGVCVEECPVVTNPFDCMDNPSKCLVYDYGPEDQMYKPYYPTVIPTIDLLNRCIPTQDPSIANDPERCAFPQCDPAKYSYHKCDSEYPKTWLMEYPYSLHCEVKLQEATTTTLKPMAASPLTDMLAEKMGWANRVVSGVQAGTTEILIFGLALPILIGFLWLVFLRLFAKTIVWLVIIGIDLFLFAATAWCWYEAGFLEEQAAAALSAVSTYTGDDTVSSSEALAQDSYAVAMGVYDTASSVGVVPDEAVETLTDMGSDPQLMQLLAWASLLVFVLYTVVIIVCRRKIKIAIAIVKESTVVIRKFPLMILYPLTTLCCQGCILALFIGLFLYLSTAEITQAALAGNTLPPTGYTFDEQMAAYQASLADGSLDPTGQSTDYTAQIIYAYTFFGFLWSTFFVQDFAYVSLSGTVVYWYFYRDSADAATKVPIFKSTMRTLKYHLGTISFGSLIMAIIRFIRIAMMALDYYTKKYQDKAGPVVKIAIKCVHCCLWCFEKTVKFITGTAYIYTAMEGSNFCRSAWLTFTLIMSSPVQLLINNFVRLILSVLQTVAIPSVCVYFCYFSLRDSGKADPIYATVVVLVVALVIARAFATIFEVTISTIFVCCTRDKRDYGSKYMPPSLKDAYGFSKKEKGSEGEGAGAK